LQAAHAAAAGVPVLPKGLIASLDAYGAIKPLGSTSIWDPAARRGGDVFQYRLPVELSVEKQKGTKEGFFFIARYRRISYCMVGRYSRCRRVLVHSTYVFFVPEATKDGKNVNPAVVCTI